MSQEKTHDLHDFMQHLQNRMKENYYQIQKRAPEDPGTAGDQGEENWRDLLSGWLPRTYEVVTKGKIISQDGRVSPQIDVLVLKSTYPKQLIDEGQKIFMAAGVAAAFECKTTLEARHIEKAVKTSVEIKNLYPIREETPYKALNTPITYGLLAHSHSWQKENSQPENNIRQKLLASDESYVSHPRLCLDLLCVADLGTWTLGKFQGKTSLQETPQQMQEKPPHEKINGATTVYMEHLYQYNNDIQYFNPIGALISYLSRRLAWEEPALRDLAEYYMGVKIDGMMTYVKERYWYHSIFSKNIPPQLNRYEKFGEMEEKSDDIWSEWCRAYL